MNATREVYFGITDEWIMYLLLVPTLAVFFNGFYRAFKRWRIGQSVRRLDRLRKRIALVVMYVLAQRKLVRDHIGGACHALIFWSMVLLFLGTVIVFVHKDLNLPIMQGGFYLYFQSLLLNVAGGLGILALASIVCYRYVVRPSRWHQGRSARQNSMMDGALLIWLLVILIQGFAVSGLRIVLTNDPYAAYRFVAWGFGQLLVAAGLSEATLAATHHFLWWFHLVTVLGWIAWLPYSKMMHVFTAPLAVFFSDLGPKGGALRDQDFRIAERIGVGAISDFTWKDLLDLDACTECGRCQENCPAHLSGTPLSPKNLILDLRSYAHKSALANGQAVSTIGPMVGSGITEESIWACTTCYACQENCPILVEHVPKIVEIRRFLLESSGPSPTLTRMLEGLAVLGNPQGLPPGDRFAIMDRLGVPLMKPDAEVEVVLWVGCAGAFDLGGQDTITALVKVLKAARVDFAALGPDEKCCGDPARRTGEEGLFQELALQNIDNLHRLRVKKILTSCPHCYNTLKNEYSSLGAEFGVIHHTQLLHELLLARRIELKRPLGEDMTYHDPCYLGRYNDLYTAPREVLRQSTTARVREMARAREMSLCCGGGGGQMYLESATGARPNRLRFAMARDLSVPILATACPLCKTMMADAARDNPNGATVRVRDVAELVAETLDMQVPMHPF